MFIETVSLKSIHGDEALDAEIAVESMRTHLVLFQILRPCETLKIDLYFIFCNNLLPENRLDTHCSDLYPGASCDADLRALPTCTCNEVKNVSLLSWLIRLPADKAVVAIYFVAGKLVLHHLVLGHSGKKDDHSLKIISEHEMVLMQKFSRVRRV